MAPFKIFRQYSDGKIFTQVASQIERAGYKELICHWSSLILMKLPWNEERVVSVPASFSES